MFLSATLAALALAQPAEAKPFELKDGDRVVWIGNTLVEREQRYGYWEAALHAAFPKANFTVRNLGWSGDTVFGEARARFDFDRPDAGLKQLVDQTLALKPTVIFVSYGTNESYEGKGGLPRFEKGLEKLLDALKPANARVVLFSPMPVEKSPSLPNPDERNKQLSDYGAAIQKVATTRGAYFADINSGLGGKPPVTENGMHLTEVGYKQSAEAFLMSLGCDKTPGGSVPESLRKAIVEKNQLFFYRWRPQNETYLFGFRKQEQGKNAKEVAEFDPLVAKAEEEIAKLKKEPK